MMQTRTVARVAQKPVPSGPQPPPKRISGTAITAGAASKRASQPAAHTNGGVNGPESTKRPVLQVRNQPQTPAKPPAPTIAKSVSDDEDYTSSSDESWASSEFNSESFQPLAFTLIKGGPARAVGGVTRSNYSVRTGSSGAVDSASDSELSPIESPLPVQLHANDAKRRCGSTSDPAAGETVVVTKMSMDDSSVSSRALPVVLELRRRARTIGPTYSKGTLEAKTIEEPRVLSTGSDDEEEAPLNAEVIRNLVRRFRDPSARPEDISLEAFQVVNWDDDTFQPELAPLRKLYDYLEAMASLKKSVSSPTIVSQKRSLLQAKVKEAVLELPTEKAITAKVKGIKTKVMESSTANHPLFRNEFRQEPKSAWDNSGERNGTRSVGDNKKGKPSKASPSVVNEGGKPGLENVKSAQPSKMKVKGNALSASGMLDGSPAVASKETTAASGQKKKRRESLIASTTSLGSSIREGQLSASNSEIFKPNAKAMSTQRAAKRVVKESTMSEEPNKKRRAVMTRKKNNPGRSVSFTDIPAPDVKEVADDVVEPQSTNAAAAEKKDVNDAPAAKANETRQTRNRARAHSGRRSRLGQSVSFASIPDVPAGEITDTTAALEAPAKQPSNARTSHRKRAVKSRNNRSCSFSEVLVDEGREIHDNEANTLAAPPPVSAPDGENGKNKKMVLRRRAVPRKSKRNPDADAPEVEQGEQIDDTNNGGTSVTPQDHTDSKGAPAANGKKERPRRSKDARKCEVSFSLVDDEVAGEIVENPAENEYLEPSSRPGTGSAAARSAVTPRVPIRPSSRQPDRALQKPAVATKLTPSLQREAPGKGGVNAQTAARNPQQRSATDKSEHTKRRRRHSSASRELSISAIPEEEAGEILETADLYLHSLSSDGPKGAAAGQRVAAKGPGNVVLPHLARPVTKK